MVFFIIYYQSEWNSYLKNIDTCIAKYFVDILGQIQVLYNIGFADVTTTIAKISFINF